MKSIELYKILQQHAGEVNALAHAIYNGKIETDEALEKARSALIKADKALNPEP